MNLSLQANLTPGAKVQGIASGKIRLEIPAGPSGSYRLAQLDDYNDLPRRNFPWKAPLRLTVTMRAAAAMPGTWGFGFWNDPFSMSLLGRRGALRLPVFPNAAWFFYASEHNYLSLRDDLPVHGFLAATFHSMRLPAALGALGVVFLPFVLLPPFARLLRRIAKRFVQQDSHCLDVDATTWHTYSLDLKSDSVIFFIDGARTFETPLIPSGRLGFVLWVDNQYMALPPDGRFRYGWLENKQPSWIEIRELQINRFEAET